MGLTISSIMDFLSGRTEKRILMLGLDAAGKTTVLYRLQLGDTVTTIPTVGFNVETVEYKNINMTIWDVGGQKKLRQLWRHYYHGCDALVYVVDSNDRDRIETARDELAHLLSQDELRDAAVLVYANKQDLQNSMSASDVVDKLQMNTLGRGRLWYVQSAVAVSGDGLYEGMEWLSRELNKQRRR